MYNAVPVFQLHELSDEPASPLTPPPNYDTALRILAQSAESILNKTRCRQSSLVRRSLSMDQVNDNRSQPNSPCGRDTTDDSENHKIERTKSRRIFRFSGKFCKNTGSDIHSSGAKGHSDSQCQSNLVTPPPYPDTPLLYPTSPPPPFSPSVPEVCVQRPSDSEPTVVNREVSS